MSFRFQPQAQPGPQDGIVREPPLSVLEIKLKVLNARAVLVDPQLGHFGLRPFEYSVIDA